MKNKKRRQTLDKNAIVFAAAILSIMSSTALAGVKEPTEVSDSLAPEATVTESTLSFRDISLLEKAFIDTAPADRKDGLVVGELGVDGGDRKMVVMLAQEIANNQHGSFDSLLISQKGRLLFESYYLRGRVNLPHPQASATKSFINLAIGRAIQLGYLTMADLDKPLIGFLEDLDPTKFVEGAEKITLHKAMTMRSGVRISSEEIEELENNPGLVQGQRQVQTYLEHSHPVSSESQTFHYQGVDPQLVVQVLDAVVPGTAQDFIKHELLEKMGITNYGWQYHVSGLPEAGSGASITSRDMIKVGTLVLNNGLWNNEQLIPAAYVAKSINRIIHTSDDEIFGGGADVSNSGYGYYWWQADMSFGDQSYFSTSAQGGGGQYIILIDELDLIVVATAHERDVSTLQVTAERIVPAFIP